MSVQCEVAARPAAAMNLFERYLTLWVALCIVLGVALSVVGTLVRARSRR